jgi:ubiquinone biosynthesis protein
MLRETRRLASITQILTKHGLYHAFLGERHYPPAKNVREAFEELGVVFLKFGQVLALRRDLLPPDYIRELEALHDRLPTMSAADVDSVISREFGKGPGDVFATFDATPIAAATIAQVHVAQLPGSRSVVVKIRRTKCPWAILWKC